MDGPLLIFEDFPTRTALIPDRTFIIFGLTRQKELENHGFSVHDKYSETKSQNRTIIVGCNFLLNMHYVLIPAISFQNLL